MAKRRGRGHGPRRSGAKSLSPFPFVFRLALLRCPTGATGAALKVYAFGQNKPHCGCRAATLGGSDVTAKRRRRQGSFGPSTRSGLALCAEALRASAPQVFCPGLVGPLRAAMNVAPEGRPCPLPKVFGGAVLVTDPRGAGLSSAALRGLGRLIVGARRPFTPSMLRGGSLRLGGSCPGLRISLGYMENVGG